MAAPIPTTIPITVLDSQEKRDLSKRPGQLCWRRAHLMSCCATLQPDWNTATVSAFVVAYLGEQDAV